MIFLFTDFGAADVYAGQVRARLLRELTLPVPIIDLLHDAPAFDACAGAHLLCALSQQFEPSDVCLAVVDPGVGSARDAVAVKAAGCWYLGPDNGVLSVVAARTQDASCYSIRAPNLRLSASFHGRDLFAPVAAQLARNDASVLIPKQRLEVEFPAADLARIIYIDHYGNAMTGLRATDSATQGRLRVAGMTLSHARTFSAAATGELFWYTNSIGLVEIACNKASAAALLGLTIGAAAEWC